MDPGARRTSRPSWGRPLLALALAAWAAGCGGCPRPGCGRGGVPVPVESSGLESAPPAPLELAAPGPGEPRGAPALLRKLEVGGQRTHGHLTLAVDGSGRHLAAGVMWLRRGSVEVEASSVVVWRLDGLTEVWRSGGTTFLDALAVGADLVAFGGSYRDRFDLVRLPGGERREVPLPAVPAGTQAPGPWLSRLAVSPDGGQLAGCVNYANQVPVWSLPALGPGWVGAHDFECERLGYSADGAELSVRYALGRNRTFDAATGRLLRAFTDGFYSEFTWSAFSPGGRLVATSTDADREVKLWDRRTGREVRSLTAVETGGPFTVRMAFHPAGRLLAIGVTGGDFRLWQLEPQALLARWSSPDHAERELDGLEFTPDGRLVAGYDDGVIEVYGWR